MHSKRPVPAKFRQIKVPVHGILVGHTFDIILPGQAKPMTLEVNKVEQIVDGVVTYSGSLAGDAEAFFTFSVEGRKSLGRILIGDVAVIVRPNGDTEGHELIMVDRGLLPIDDDTIPSNPENTSGTTDTFSTTGASSTGSGDVRTLFLFANNVGNESLMTSTIISEFNNALSRSGVASSNKLSSVGIITVASGFIGEQDCKGKILYDMHKRISPFTNLDQWMNDNAADIAFLIVENGPVSVDCPTTETFAAPSRIGGASTGFFPGETGIQDHSQSPFSMSSETFALGDLTALHEIGHSLGGRHADSSIPEEMDFLNGEFAHGFDNNNAGEWQTIMGGYRASTANRCAFDFDNPDPVTQPCERIPYFSNPAKSATINGHFVPALGATTITGTPGDVNVQFKADMETWLETSGMPIVSGYFQDPPPPTSARFLT
ncbi:MAG: hypothetical protein RQ847_11850 [Wenzhouxiangellaceae bacterium]|nr:hypothetical protein [Wenzhouxiangellaceae bacterium]